MKRTNILLKAAFLIAVTILFSSVAPEIRAATYTVDTTVDYLALSACTSAENDCSLRGAIANVNSTLDDDTIEFAIPLTDTACTADAVCTITAFNGPFSVSAFDTAGRLAITNPSGAGKLIISGNNQFSVLTNNGVLTLTGITVTNVNSSDAAERNGWNILQSDTDGRKFKRRVYLLSDKRRAAVGIDAEFDDGRHLRHADTRRSIFRRDFSVQSSRL